jgi:molybdate transport system substrate-binding protein
MFPFQGLAAPQELLVAAAADLAPVEVPMSQAFQKVAGIRVRFVFGASGMLRQQIAQGAPYDVFLSANQKFVTELAASGRLAPDTVRTYAYGRLGIWSKSGAIRELGQLRDPKLLHVAIANPVHAPYGMAAQEALESAGLWKELQSRLVYGENVRQALQFAESGNAEAVITAWSLVADRGGVLVPEKLHQPIRQTGGMVAATAHPAEAKRFLEFLTSAEGLKILEAHGLFAPTE